MKEEEKELDAIGKTILEYALKNHQSESNSTKTIEKIKQSYEILHKLAIIAIKKYGEITDNCECKVCETAKNTTKTLLEHIDQQSEFLTMLKPLQKDIYMAIGIASATAIFAKLHIINTFDYIHAAHEAYSEIVASKLEEIENPDSGASRLPNPNTLN